MSTATSERDKQIATLYQAGSSLADIARTVLLSRERVRQILSRDGIERRPMAEPSDAVIRAAQMVVDCDGSMSMTEAADSLGVGTSGLAKFVGRHYDFDYISRRSAFIEQNVPHGEYRYQQYGCRCEICTAGNSARHSEWRLRASLRTPPDRVHGTTGGYSNWGCRCKLCVDAQKAANARRYRS